MIVEHSVCTLNGVTKSYRSPRGDDSICVLRNIDLEIRPGEALCIVGPSGSGKSTLLNIMGCLDSPDAGEVLVGGRQTSSLTADELARIRNQDIGFVFQLHHLLPQCTVLENVLIPTLPYVPRSEDPAERAGALLERVGLGARLDHRPSELSGGESLRVAVARALVNQPGMLLADEPTGSLDVDTSDMLGDLLVELNREHGMALIVVTHSTDLAARIGRTYHLRNGVLVP